MSSAEPILSVNLGKLRLKNPVMPASGTFGYGQEFAEFVNLNDLGAIIVKCTTLAPRLGSFENRLVEIPGGILSTIGLQNVGVHRFVKEKLPYLRQFDTPVIVNIGGGSVEEFVKVAEILNRTGGIAGLEINISCPNVAQGGMHFGIDPDTTYNVVKSVRECTDLTIIVKLTPVSNVSLFAKICEEAGADAVSLINAIPGMAIDIETRKPKLGKNIAGGVTGPCLKPIALKMVWDVVRAVKIPVIGIGGISSAEDALEFLIAGATAIQIGTYNFVDPQAMIKIIRGIRDYLVKKRLNDIRELIGTLKIET
ncbi:MAG: dihydroorotate dehydrogenase [Deltaproteobacteria bacterium]|nr:MAG: dihydroorotate dehydrogenase [Deltaproteobacteria bacterium]RLA96257.1 MAG: dihydroorotate dehydrogenase [Deltaproteobacteria bacterium]